MTKKFATLRKNNQYRLSHSYITNG